MSDLIRNMEQHGTVWHAEFAERRGEKYVKVIKPEPRKRWQDKHGEPLSHRRSLLLDTYLDGLKEGRKVNSMMRAKYGEDQQ